MSSISKSTDFNSKFKPSVSHVEMESAWQNLIPDSLLLDIFSYLDIKTLGRAARVCTTWHRIVRDELLWQQLARRIWKIKSGLAPGKTSWYSEVKRLVYHVPLVCCETIEKHTDEVLDVSISHSGQYFCTCSKDALVILWELGNEMHSRIVQTFDTSLFLKWQLSQYSTFSPDDSLILVCGVKSYDHIPVDIDTEYKAGVGAIFTVPDLNLVSVVEMDPATMFGAWLNERVFVGGWPGSRPNTVDILAYKVFDYQLSNPVIAPKSSDATSLVEYRTWDGMKYNTHDLRLFTFEGNRYHLMNLLVANVPDSHRCSWGSCDSSGSCDLSGSHDNVATKQRRKRTPQYDESYEVPEARKVKVKGFNNSSSYSHIGREMRIDHSEHNASGDNSCDIPAAENSSLIRNSQSYSQAEKSSPKTLLTCTVCDIGLSEGNLCKTCLLNKSSEEDNERTNGKRSTDMPCLHLQKHASEQEISNSAGEKVRYKQYVTFVTGDHDAIAVHEIKPEHLRKVSKNNTEEGRELQTDKVDYSFHLRDCYITGLCLSHDQRFLYFNFREMDKAAPENKVDHFDDELPVSEKVFCKDLKIGGIDLVAMEMVKDIEFSGHVGYSSFPAWYICLDACPEYIGSGSEDMRGYIWDRHYGVCLGRLFHSSLDTGDNTLLVMSMHENSVVNGLAFSPVDQETCITVCDDRLIKVWRSKHKMKALLQSGRKKNTYKEMKMKLQKLRSSFEIMHNSQS